MPTWDPANRIRVLDGAEPANMRAEFDSVRASIATHVALGDGAIQGSLDLAICRVLTGMCCAQPQRCTLQM